MKNVKGKGTVLSGECVIKSRISLEDLVADN